MSFELTKKVYDRFDDPQETSSGEQALLLALADFCNDKTLQCNPSDEAIRKKNHFNIKTIRGARTSLVEKGILICQEVPGRSCRYRINFLPKNQSPIVDEVPPRVEDEGYQKRQGGLPKLVRGVTKIGNRTYKEPITEPTTELGGFRNRFFLDAIRKKLGERWNPNDSANLCKQFAGHRNDSICRAIEDFEPADWMDSPAAVLISKLKNCVDSKVPPTEESIIKSELFNEFAAAKAEFKAQMVHDDPITSEEK